MGARLKNGDAKIVGVFRVKNHDFTQKNHIFSNFREGHATGVPPPLPGSAPAIYLLEISVNDFNVQGL